MSPKALQDVPVSRYEALYKQGLNLFEQGSEEGKEKSLLQACKKFKAALTHRPDSCEVWQAWGNTLTLLGMNHSEHRYFKEAEEKFREGSLYLEEKPPEFVSEFFWDYALALRHSASCSGEALDWQKALGTFQRAQAGMENKLPPEFWMDVASANLKMGALVLDLKLTVRAITYFKLAVSLLPKDAEAWHALAGALEELYNHTHEEDHFSQANECFKFACDLDPHNAPILVHWASFLCEAGRLFEKPQRLSECVEKCQLAYLENPKNAHVVAIWAEALALYGELTEEVMFIHDAEEKMEEALALSPDGDPLIAYSCGKCLESLGKYYDDFDYYFQAIEQFQQGLTVDRTSHRHWGAIATTYLSVARLDGNPDTYAKAARFYSKASYLNPSSSSYAIGEGIALTRIGEILRDGPSLELAAAQFEKGFSLQKNAFYTHPAWLFYYARVLDLLADLHEEEAHYQKAIEMLIHVLTLDPHFPDLHYALALTFMHWGEFTGDQVQFYRALHHYRIAHRQDGEDDYTLMNWGVTLLHVAEHNPQELDLLYLEAEQKFLQAAKLGNEMVYTHLAQLHSLKGNPEKAMVFLEKAFLTRTLPPLEELLEDPWLEGVRSSPLFEGILALFGK